MSTNDQRIGRITSNLLGIASCTSVVLDHINDSPHQDQLLADGKLWNMVVSATWVLGDTDLAISSYLQNPFPADDGSKYLLIYGLLQALFLQQDAVNHLCEGLDIKIEDDRRLREIRNIRNLAIGHPTHLERKPNNYFGYLSRISLSFGSFDLIKSEAKARSDEFLKIDTIELIGDQVEILLRTMQTVSTTIEGRRLEHLDQFRDRKLLSLLPENMGYHFEKISQGIFSPGSGNRDFALSMLYSVRDKIQALVDALQARGELSDFTRYDADTYLRGISQIERYLTGAAPELIDRDARIYAHYVRDEYRAFRQIAQEIDEKYEGAKI